MTKNLIPTTTVLLNNQNGKLLHVQEYKKISRSVSSKMKILLTCRHCQHDENVNEESTNRVRAFAHERGNWATYIYIPSKFKLLNCCRIQCPNDLFISISAAVPFSDSIRELQSRIVETFANDTGIRLHTIESLHISLTRTVVLQHHWIDDFKKSVRESISNSKKYRRIRFLFSSF